MIKLTLTKHEWDEIHRNHIPLNELLNQYVAHWDLMRIVDIYLDDKMASNFLLIDYKGLSSNLTAKLDTLREELSCVYGPSV